MPSLCLTRENLRHMILVIAVAFSDSLMASGRWKHPPVILKNTKGMTMKFLPYVGTHMETHNQKIISHVCLGL